MVNKFLYSTPSDEDFFGIQIAGSKVDQVAKCVELLEKECEYAVLFSIFSFLCELQAIARISYC